MVVLLVVFFHELIVDLVLLERSWHCGLVLLGIIKIKWVNGTGVLGVGVQFASQVFGCLSVKWSIYR